MTVSTPTPLYGMFKQFLFESLEIVNYFMKTDISLVNYLFHLISKVVFDTLHKQMPR